MTQERYYYSPDGGESWVGPFDLQQMGELRASGIVQSSFPVRTEGAQQYWILQADGLRQGPYTTPELIALATAGRVRRGTLIIVHGQPNPVPFASLGIPMADRKGEPTGTNGGENDAPIHPPQHHDIVDRFSFRRFFSGVFNSHTQEDIVDALSAGTPTCTPDIRNINATWPSPWIFARVAFFCAIMYLVLSYMMTAYPNPMLIPAILFVANFGIPFCVVVLLYEMNIRRDVPFYTVIKSLLLGSVLSFLIMSLLDRYMDLGYEAYWAGPIEEPAKLVAAVIVASTYRNGRILTGMLIGCAVGAGFAAFESAGYAMDHFMRAYTVELLSESDDIKQAMGGVYLSQEQIIAGLEIVRTQISNMSVEPLKELSLSRALLTPAGHVVWTAITAGAYWYVLSLNVKAGLRAANDRSVDFSVLVDGRFLKFALIPVGLHMIWNSPIGADLLGWSRYLVLGFVAWVVLLRLAHLGIAQVKEEKMKIQNL